MYLYMNFKNHLNNAQAYKNARRKYDKRERESWPPLYYSGRF